MEVDGAEEKVEFAQLKMRTEYYVDHAGDHGEDDDEDVKVEDDEENLLDGPSSEKQGKSKSLEKVEKEELIRGFKYGTTYAPCPDGHFPKLPTRKGIEICGFFPTKNVRLFVNKKGFSNCRYLAVPKRVRHGRNLVCLGRSKLPPSASCPFKHCTSNIS